MKNKNGFTLIEVLLGLAITAIIGVVVYNMFWSAMRLDEKMKHVHEQYMEVLMADQGLSQDLENAISLDFSSSYPNAVIFDGHPQELSFLVQTSQGIKHVRYFTGLPGDDEVTKRMTGRVVNPLSKNAQGLPPVEFLMRQESSLADWLNETGNSSTQVVAAGLLEDSFHCYYAPFAKDLHTNGARAIDYQDAWDQKGLPMVVSCSFSLYAPHQMQQGLEFRRDIFLAPLRESA